MKILSLSSGNRLDGEMSPIVKAQNRSLQQAGVEIGIYALLESQIRFGKAKIALNDVLSHLLDDNETKIEEVLAFSGYGDMKSFKDLEVWKRGIDLVEEISGFTQIAQITQI